MFTRTRENARNKEYANLFMKVHGVQGPSLHCDLELKISYQNLFEQGGVSLGCKPA